MSSPMTYSDRHTGGMRKSYNGKYSTDTFRKKCYPAPPSSLRARGAALDALYSSRPAASYVHHPYNASVPLAAEVMSTAGDTTSMEREHLYGTRNKAMSGTAVHRSTSNASQECAAAPLPTTGNSTATDTRSGSCPSVHPPATTSSSSSAPATESTEVSPSTISPSTILYHPPVHFHNISNMLEKKVPPVCVVTPFISPSASSSITTTATPAPGEKNAAEPIKDNKHTQKNVATTEKRRDGAKGYPPMQQKECYPSSFTAAPPPPGLPQHAPLSKSSSRKGSRKPATKETSSLLSRSAVGEEGERKPQEWTPSYCFSDARPQGESEYQTTGGITDEAMSASTATTAIHHPSSVESSMKRDTGRVLFRGKSSTHSTHSTTSTISSDSTLPDSSSPFASRPLSVGPTMPPPCLPVSADYVEPTDNHMAWREPADAVFPSREEGEKAVETRTSLTLHGTMEEDTVLGLTLTTNHSDYSLSSTMRTPVAGYEDAQVAIPLSTLVSPPLAPYRRTGKGKNEPRREKPTRPFGWGQKKEKGTHSFANVPASSAPSSSSTTTAPLARRHKAPRENGVVPFAPHHYASVNFRFGSAWFISPFQCSAGDIVVVEYPSNQSLHMGIISGITTVKPTTFYSKANNDPVYLSEEELAILPRLLRHALPSDKETKLALRDSDLQSLEHAQALAIEREVPVFFQDAEWLFDGSALTFLVHVFGDVSLANELADELATREGAEVVFTYPSS